MHMRRVSKALCAALSLMLIVNLVGFEAMASEADGKPEQTSGTAGADQSTEDKDKTGESKEEPEDKGSANTPVINDSTPEPSEPDGNPEGEGNDGDAADVPDHKDDLNNGVLPEQPEAGPEEETEPEETEPAEEQKALEAQEITGLTAKPVAGSTDQMEISWNAAEDVTYKVKVKDEDNKEVTYDGPSDGKLTVPVTAGKRYDVTVEGTVGEEPNTQTETETIPVILLLSPAVKVTADDTSVKISWDAVAGATEYEVVYGGKTEKTTGTSYTVETSADVTKYEVKAVCTLKDAAGKEYMYESALGSDILDEKPAKVKGLTGIDGEKSAILTWSKAAGAASYIVYRYNSSSKKWKVVKRDIKKLTYTDKKLTPGKKYKYRVAAMNNGGVGEMSTTVTVSVKKTPGTKVRSIGYKATVKSRAPLFNTKKSSKRVRYLNPGTRVTTIDYGSGRYQIKLSNGKTYWLSKDRLTFRSSIWTTKDYSTKVKEDFVNKRGYKSPTKYLIWISQYTQRVIIFQGKKGKWKMIRSGRCATGTHLHMTPKGIFKITYKEKGWFYRTTYEKPIVHFKSQNSFHSRIKNYKGGYADATIGRPRSKGCVRLYDEDINFIYKKCPKGTTVISH